MIAVRNAGLPPALARARHGLVTTQTARETYAEPRPQLARLVNRGLLRRAAPGVFAVVPAEQIGLKAWRPGFEALAAGIAEAIFGRRKVALMGVTAARMHRAIPRALATAVVAAPRRRHPMRLKDRDGVIRFVERDVAALDTQLMDTGRGNVLVTTIEQTVLDLAHRPDLGGARVDAEEAIRVLLPRCHQARLEQLAGQDRLRAALNRARDLLHTNDL